MPKGNLGFYSICVRYIYYCLKMIYWLLYDLSEAWIILEYTFKTYDTTYLQLYRYLIAILTVCIHQPQTSHNVSSFCIPWERALYFEDMKTTIKHQISFLLYKNVYANMNHCCFLNILVLSLYHFIPYSLYCNNINVKMARKEYLDKSFRNWWPTFQLIILIQGIE